MINLQEGMHYMPIISPSHAFCSSVKTNPAAPSAPFFCTFMALFQCVSPPLQLCSACATHLVFLGVLFQGFIRFLGTALCECLV